MTARKGPAPVKQSTAAFELRSRYFMLRAPILSLVDSKQLLGDDASLQKNLLKLPFVEEAIFVASNNLHERAYRTPYESGRDSKLDLALGRYLSRMATRPTPFGLFSSVSIGHLRSNAPSLALRASHVRRHVRLDNELLCAICATLLSTDSVSRAIRWFPNDTLLRLGESYRYTEVAIVNGQRTFKLSQAAADDALVPSQPGVAEKRVTYTNNWPHEPLVHNRLTGDAVVWTGVSIILLLAGIAGWARIAICRTTSAVTYSTVC